jgi:hypothetical protein
MKKANNIKVIHSFWSKPFLNNRWGVTDQFRKNIFTYALSAVYAKKMFGNITLVCDSVGAELLEIIEYNEINNSLDDLEEVNPKFWTYGKVKSLSLYNEPVLHIDGDVLLIFDTLKEVFLSNWDVIVQMKEIGSHYTSTYSEMLPTVSKVVGFIDYGLYNFVYNCGVIGFKDIEFKNQYCHTFFDTIEKCNLGISELDKIDGKYEINCALEQSLLTVMAENNNKYVKEILPLAKMEEISLQGLANKIGYAHLWGKAKYDEFCLNKVRKKLYELDEKLYKRVMSQYKKYSV